MAIVFRAMVDDRFAGEIPQQGVERGIGFQLHSSAREIGIWPVVHRDRR